MISKPQNEPIEKEDSLTSTSAVSSLPQPMSFWLAKIKVVGEKKLEKELRDCAKDARFRTSLVLRGNGTIFVGAILEGATVHIMADGSVLIFTAAGI